LVTAVSQRTKNLLGATMLISVACKRILENADRNPSQWKLTRHGF